MLQGSLDLLIAHDEVSLRRHTALVLQRHVPNSDDVFVETDIMTAAVVGANGTAAL